jgi:diguanylate cyclase (GGDEF)-like protein
MLEVMKSESLVIISSLIVKDGNTLGRDIVIYNLEPLMEQMGQEHLKCAILLGPENPETYENNEKIIAYRKLLDTDYWLESEKSKDDLYYRLNNLSSKIIIGFLILLGILSTLFYKISKETSIKVINQLEEKVEKITEISETDGMLGIYNRSKFFKTLNSEIYRCHRYKQNLSLIMIDVDHFKEINDNYGHLLGDEILKRISEIIKNEVRTIDLFARYGGDEFMILSPETNIDEAINLAKRLKNLLEKEKFPKVENVSCSFGVTQLKETDTIDSLIKRVDKGLYKAKESRDTVYFL